MALAVVAGGYKGRRGIPFLKPKISVVINTLNEENDLPNAIKSVIPWADEVVVVDQHSDDRTVEIARSLGATVYMHERTGCVEPVRKFAVEQCTGEWVLILDADEMVSKELSDLLVALADPAKTASSPGPPTAYRIPRENYLCGRLMSGSGWAAEDDLMLRFFPKGALVFSGRIHDGAHPAAGTTVVDIPYIPGRALVHFSYIGVADFINRLNRYTSEEVFNHPDDRPTKAKTFRRALREFYKRYYRRKGYRDGWQGLYLALAMSFYKIATDAKAVERQAGGVEAARDTYRAVAAQVLDEYVDATTADKRNDSS